MRTRKYLYWPVSHALDSQSNPLAPVIELDRPGISLDRDYGAGLPRVLVYGRLGKREHVLRGNG
jgi:hypothetical protein